jgi:hypothetical protein
MGKLYRTAQPHAPGGTVNWTTYTYDALNHLTQVSMVRCGGYDCRARAVSYSYDADETMRWAGACGK